jgi:hypothetical protein
MDFKLERAEYDGGKQRAYVEFRAPDDDGGQAIVTAIFSYQTSERLSKQRLKEDIIRKGRHLCRRAYKAT